MFQVKYYGSQHDQYRKLLGLKNKTKVPYYVDIIKYICKNPNKGYTKRDLLKHSRYSEGFAGVELFSALNANNILTYNPHNRKWYAGFNFLRYVRAYCKELDVKAKSDVTIELSDPYFKDSISLLLRARYGRYIAKDCKYDVTCSSKHHISNICWGRKLSNSELDKVAEKLALYIKS